VLLAGNAALTVPAWAQGAAGAPAATAAPTPPPPDAIYAAEFDDESGQVVALARWKGQRLLLNFWATWCAPCVHEMPALEKLGREVGAGRLAIVGIGAEKPEKVRAFRKAHGLKMTLLAGGYEAIDAARALGDRDGVLPYTVLLSPEGQVLQVHVGEISPATVREWLRQADSAAHPATAR
jgi:peroxiredoxin